jgi:hypothetical protein
MRSFHPQPHSLQTLHETLAILSDVFCEQVCKKCQWSASTFYFHLHNPGHLKKSERQKINKAMRGVLANTLAALPQIEDN